MITVRIEMTIATIGRSMKNLDISVALHKRLRADCHARTSLLDALGYYALARLYPFGYDPHGTDPIAEFHGPNADPVCVVHDGDLIAALQFRHSALRNKQRTCAGPDRCTDPPVLPRPQPVPGVREEPRQLNRASILIHLAIREGE